MVWVEPTVGKINRFRFSKWDGKQWSPVHVITEGTGVLASASVNLNCWHSTNAYIMYYWMVSTGERELLAVSLQKEKRVRLVRGWICLLAVAFMHAPLAGAAWLLNSDCCAAGYCQVPAHHQAGHGAARAKQMPSQDREMKCEHEGGGRTACSMSRCQDGVRPALMPVAFILPAATIVSGPSATLCPVPVTAVSEIPQFVKPLSPPPRLASFVL